MAMHGANVDLAAQSTRYNMAPFGLWRRNRHTKPFDRIIKKMEQNTSIAPHWTSTEATPCWTCISDALQRHSRAYSRYLYDQLSQNVFAFGECLVMPIAWEGNFTSQELSGLLLNDGISIVAGLESLTGVKILRSKALDWFVNENDSNSTTLIYHEDSRFNK